MQALFIGQSYIDVTFLADELPTGDEKTVARDYAVAFGGNAVTAAFCCAKLGMAPDLMTSIADDWLGRMFVDMAAKYGISVHHRKVAQSSLSFIMPKGGQRAIVRCRDDNFKHPFPVLNLAGCRALHVDGHLADAAIHYANICHEAGILTSLDGRGLRSNTHDLLAFIGTAVVAERLCEQMNLTPGEMLTYLRSRGCRVGGVTMGAKGLLWYDETKNERFFAGARCPRAPGHRHQRRRRHLSRRLCLFVSGRPRCRMGAALQVRARSIGAFDPASRQRSEPAHAGADQRDRGAIRRAAADPGRAGSRSRARQARDEARNRAPLVSRFRRSRGNADSKS